jgi:hypothetical protein
MHDEQIEVAVEVHSAWGTFEWFIEDALRREYHIGIVANSDGHTCRPGSSHPGAGKFGSFGGLTCVLAERLDRQSIYKAIMARRFYATTGNRPLISLAVETSEEKNPTQMGGCVETGCSCPPLYVKASVAGTAPIERVELRNGVTDSIVLRPYGEDDLGSRIKVLWSGAEVKGRARIARWDGWLRIEGNRILGAHPVNFWDPERAIRRGKENTLSWNSATTGGTAGIIIELEDMESGELEISTTQGGTRFPIAGIGLAAKTQKLGGVRKKLEIYRLPANPWIRPFALTLPLARDPQRGDTKIKSGLNLHRGFNPIYLYAVQEDGHMAWTSPVSVTLT